MQVTIPGNNPFAILTAVVAPAILTNASSVLALGTSNRLARVVDRTRVVASHLANLEPGGAEHNAWSAQLDGLQVRAQLLVRALRAVYASLGLFASAALVSVLGSIVAYYGSQITFKIAVTLNLLTGIAAVLGLATGCTLMVRETRLAVQGLTEEAKLAGGVRR